jgi:hypothetical protein
MSRRVLRLSIWILTMKLCCGISQVVVLTSNPQRETAGISHKCNRIQRNKTWSDIQFCRLLFSFNQNYAYPYEKMPSLHDIGWCLLRWAVGTKKFRGRIKLKGRTPPYISIFLPYRPRLLTVAFAYLHRLAYQIYLPLFSIRSFWCSSPVQNMISHNDWKETKDEGIQTSLPSIDLIFSSGCRNFIVDVPYWHLPQSQAVMKALCCVLS